MDETTQANGEVPTGSYRLMTSDAEAVVAIEQVVAAAAREIRLFDATPRTLRARGFGSPSRIETLRTKLLAGRGHRLRVVLHDTRAIETELPRLIALLTAFSGQIQIHRTIGQAREARDALIIADDRHFWRKLHIDQPRSVITLDDATGARPIHERFEEIWEKSELAVSGSMLGL